MKSDLAAAASNRLRLRDQMLDAYPQLAEDEAALLDTLDGLDTLNEQAVAVLRQAIEREAHAEALKAIIDTMAERKRRLETGAHWLREAALLAMQSAGLPRLTAPDMTVSVGSPKPAVVITDAAALPDHLCRVKREPDKRAIGAALEAKQTVPGAVLGNAQPFLQIHRR